jgi:hypothetical protein
VVTITREKFQEAIECLDTIRDDETDVFDAIMSLEDMGITITDEIAPSHSGREGLWVFDNRSGSKYSEEVESWQVTDQIAEEMEFECGIMSRDMNCNEWERLQGTPSWKRVEKEVIKERIAMKIADELEIDY